MLHLSCKVRVLPPGKILMSDTTYNLHKFYPRGFISLILISWGYRILNFTAQTIFILMQRCILNRIGGGGDELVKFSSC